MIKTIRFYLDQYYWIGILLVPLLILLPGLNEFPYPPKADAYSDISVTHYPNALFLQKTIFQDHTIPLWSPTILSGYPFSANPLSGLWYPPGWLAIILPLPLAFNISIFLHLLWAGIGMYLLLRAESLSKFPAVFGSVVFIALPKLFAHYGAGHLSLLYGICWTPWLLYSSRKYLLTNKAADYSGFRHIIEQPAIVWGLILLADVRWAAYAGMMWWYYILFHARYARELNQKFRFIRSLLIQTSLGFLLAAPLILPLLQYTNLSTRSSMTAKDMLVFSLPPAKLLGLLFPDFGGFYEWVVYAGAVVLLLVVIGFTRSKQTVANKCWIWAVVLSLCFALGSNLPFSATIANIPGLNLLRVPSRMVFLTGLGMAALAGHHLQWLLSGLSPVEIRRTRLALAGLATFCLLITAGGWIISQSPPTQLIWGSAFIFLGIVFVILLQEKRITGNFWQVGVLIICLLDLYIVDSSLFTMRSAEIVLAENKDIAEYLAQQPGEYRVYSPSYSLPQQTSARYGLELANGVDPLQLQSYATYLQLASGIPSEGYSVVLPPLADGSRSSNDSYTPDAKMLGLLNVGYVLSSTPLHADGLEKIPKFIDTNLYQNRYVLPRAWVESDGTIQPATMDTRTPNLIQVSANGPGLLSIAEIIYPGWRAWVDGDPATILAKAGVLRSVELSPGEHVVIFRFLPTMLFVGFGLMLLGMTIIIVIGRGIL